MLSQNIILGNNKVKRITYESDALVKINKKILHTAGIKPLQIQLFGSTIVGRIKKYG